MIMVAIQSVEEFPPADSDFAGGGAVLPLAQIYQLDDQRGTAAKAPSPPGHWIIVQSGLLPALAISLTGLVGYFAASGLAMPISPWVALAIFAAATVSSIAGFAFSAICGAMLFHLVARPVNAVEIMLLCSIAIQSLSVVTLKNAIDVRHLGRFLIGGALGLPIGLYLLTHVSGSIYMKCIGAFLVAYGLYMLFRRTAAADCTHPAGDYIAGLCGGVTGGFAAFPGAFVTIWCGFKGWSKDRQRGVYQPFILIMQVVALASVFLLQTTHVQTHSVDLAIIAYVPAALLGTWCGIAIFRRLSEVQFARSVNLLLIVSGVGLVL
jgi:uncharacterized protein